MYKSDLKHNYIRLPEAIIHIHINLNNCESFCFIYSYSI